jgi:hypothetical protein
VAKRRREARGFLVVKEVPRGEIPLYGFLGRTSTSYAIEDGSASTLVRFVSLGVIVVVRRVENVYELVRDLRRYRHSPPAAKE